MTDWQDIESAPRDMSDVLVWDGKECWIAHQNYLMDWTSKSAYAVDSDEEGFYLATASEAGLTHWHPLPPPPKVKA